MNREINSSVRKNILITGMPGVGKTTLIKKIANELKHLSPAGFYTDEIRVHGERVGFKLIDLNGRRAILSHKDIKSPYRVGKYGVDIKAFEEFLSLIPFFSPSTCVIIIDEIGKMECFSKKFKILLNEILNSKKLLIATIAMKGAGLISEIKKRKDIILFSLTTNNRDFILNEILKELLHTTLPFSKEIECRPKQKTKK